MTFVQLQYIIAVDTTVILLQRPNIVLDPACKYADT